MSTPDGLFTVAAIVHPPSFFGGVDRTTCLQPEWTPERIARVGADGATFGLRVAATAGRRRHVVSDLVRQLGWPWRERAPLAAVATELPAQWHRSYGALRG